MRYRIHSLIADMINSMSRVSFIIPVLFIASAAVPSLLSARDLAADSTAGVYRTGKIDPKSEDPPAVLSRLLELNPAAGIEEIAGYLTEDTDDRYRRVKRIHDWICNTVSFDKNRLIKNGFSGGGPEAAVRAKKGNSRDFAELFQLLCKLSDIEAVVIRGFSNRFYSENGRPLKHYWNGVNINGRWYIVDTAEDASGGYTDRELFLHPEAKALTHLPEDDRYQFLETPVSREEFLSRPLLQMELIKYDIELLDGFEEKEERFVSAPEGPFAEKQDIMFAERSEVALRFSVPEYIAVYSILRDRSGQLYRRHAFVHAEQGSAAVRFTLPGYNDTYTASVFVADVRSGKRGLLYTFFISPPKRREPVSAQRVGQTQLSQLETSLPVSPLLPAKRQVYTTSWLYRYGCRVLDDFFDSKNFPFLSYRSITIEHPEDVELRAVLQDADGREVPGAVLAVSAGVNRTKYITAGPAVGRYVITIDGRKRGVEETAALSTGALFKTVAAASFFEHSPRPPGTLPPEHYLYTEHFFRQDFRFLGDNFHRAAEEGVYRIVFQSSEDYRLDCFFTGLKGEKAAGAAVYECYGDIYYFYFYPPAGGGGTAEIVSTGPDGVSRSVCRIFLEPVTPHVLPQTGADTRRHDYAYEEGWLYRKSGLRDLNVRLVYEDLHRGGRPGYAVVELEKAADICLAAGYETLAGEDRRKGNIIFSTPDVRRKIYYFRLPDDSPVKVTLLAGTVDYDIPLADFMLYPDSENKRAIPPAGEIIFYEQFYRNGFEYVSDTLPAEDGVGAYELQIRRPEAAKLSCRLYRRDGTEITDTVRFRVRDDRYIFTVEPPEGESNITGRVLYYNRRGQWRTMCWFPLP